MSTLTPISLQFGVEFMVWAEDCTRKLMNAIQESIMAQFYGR